MKRAAYIQQPPVGMKGMPRLLETFVGFLGILHPLHTIENAIVNIRKRPIYHPQIKIIRNLLRRCFGFQQIDNGHGIFVPIFFHTSQVIIGQHLVIIIFAVRIKIDSRLYLSSILHINMILISSLHRQQ